MVTIKLSDGTLIENLTDSSGIYFSETEIDFNSIKDKLDNVEIIEGDMVYSISRAKLGFGITIVLDGKTMYAFSLDPINNVELRDTFGVSYLASLLLTDEQAVTAPFLFNEWDPNGASYTAEVSKVTYNDLLYKCLQSHVSQASWNPADAVSLWVRIDDPAIEWPEWRQPTGAHDAYSIGAKVSHNDKHWVSNTDNNTWEPGVYGWDEQIEESE